MYLLLAIHPSLSMLGIPVLAIVTGTAALIVVLTVVTPRSVASQPPFLRSYFRLTPKRRILALAFVGLGEIGGVLLGYVLLSIAVNR
jgi:hypothetical protein